METCVSPIAIRLWLTDSMSVISWQAIVERLLEDEYDQSHNEEGPAAAHLVSLYDVLARQNTEHSVVHVRVVERIFREQHHG